MTTVEVQATAIPSHEGRTVRVKGHVHAVRNLGNIVFIIVRTADGTVQTVAHEPTIVAVARSVTPETIVVVEGAVVSQSKNAQQFELSITKLEVLSQPVETLPVEISKISKMDAVSLQTMLDYRPITLRSEKARAVFKIEAELCAGFREFLGSERFVEIHSPKIVSTGTEGGANLFP